MALLPWCLFILLLWMKDHVDLYVFLQNIFNTELWIMFKITLPPEMCLSKYDLDIKVLWCCIPILYLDVIWSKICARALSKAKPWIIMVSVSATYWHLSCLSKYESMFGSRLVASESFLLSDFPYAGCSLAFSGVCFLSRSVQMLAVWHWIEVGK